MNCGLINDESCIQLGGELEEPSDFNSDGIFNDKDGKYNGVLCAENNSDNCSPEKSLDVRDQLVLVMSGSTAYFKLGSTGDAVSQTIDDDNDPATPEVANPNFNSADSVVYIAGENTGSASITIADLHNQPMPAGTKVTFTATAGSVAGTSSFDWPNDNHNGGREFAVSIKGETEPKSGSLIVTVETPSGAVSVFSGIGIVIQ
jgi:hypothetical protein